MGTNAHTSYINLKGKLFFLMKECQNLKKKKERKSKKGHALKDPQGILVQQIHAKPLMIASVFL